MCATMDRQDFLFTVSMIEFQRNRVFFTAVPTRLMAQTGKRIDCSPPEIVRFAFTIVSAALGGRALSAAMMPPMGCFVFRGKCLMGQLMPTLHTNP